MKPSCWFPRKRLCIYVSHLGRLEKEAKQGLGSILAGLTRKVRRYEILNEIGGRLWKHGEQCDKSKEAFVRWYGCKGDSSYPGCWERPSGWKAWTWGSLWIIFSDSYVCDLRSQWQRGRKKINNASCLSHQACHPLQDARFPKLQEIRNFSTESKINAKQLMKDNRLQPKVDKCSFSAFWSVY